MQTFLPFERFELSAQSLDSKRLGKQCAETNQIISTLIGESFAWCNHPAVIMWRGYEFWLWTYGWAMNKEWHRRFNEYRLEWYTLQLHKAQCTKNGSAYPHWLGDEAFHLSHRSNLCRKSDHYTAQWPDVPKDLPYVWPTGLYEA